MDKKTLAELSTMSEDQISAHFISFQGKERIQLLLTLADMVTGGMIDPVVRNTAAKFTTEKLREEVVRLIKQSPSQVQASSVATPPAPEYSPPTEVEPPPPPPAAAPAPEEPKRRRRAPTPEAASAPAAAAAPSEELQELRNEVKQINQELTKIIAAQAEIRTELAVLLTELRATAKTAGALGQAVAEVGRAAADTNARLDNLSTALGVGLG